MIKALLAWRRALVFEGEMKSIVTNDLESLLPEGRNLHINRVGWIAISDGPPTLYTAKPD